MVQFLRVEQFGDIVVVVVAHRHEIFLLLVLGHCGQKVFHLARCTKEHLAFAILHVFLDVERNGLGYAKILQRLGNGYAQLFGQLEKVVDGVARCKHDSRVIGNTYLLLAKLFGRDAFHLNKGAEHQINAILSLYIEVGRLITRRFGLRY